MALPSFCLAIANKESFYTVKVSYYFTRKIPNYKFRLQADTQIIINTLKLDLIKRIYVIT